MFAKAVPVTGVVMLLTLAGISSSAAEDPTSQPPSPEAQEATVVSTNVKRPKRVVHRTLKVRLTTRPEPAEVRSIIAHEAALWGVSAAGLSRRVACESRYHWWATNGQYSGVLQFGSGTFWRGMTTIKTLRYVTVGVKFRRMHSRVYRHWSDGRVTRNKGRIVRQRMTTKYIGQIPRSNNTHAQIRIGAQALRGISAVHSSEWACSA